MRYSPVDTYLQEAEELLADVEQAALSLGAGQADGETIHRLFRAFHTIKGSGAMCGLDAVANFTHHVESLLDSVRGGSIPVSRELADMVLKSRDHIRLLLGACTGGEPVPQGLSEALITAIGNFGGTIPAPVEMAPARPTERSEERRAGAGPAWRIQFRPGPSLLAYGGNPVALLRELRNLGACEVVVHTEEVPTLDIIQPDVCYLWWTITLHSGADENAIRDIFIFVEDSCKLEIERIADTSGGLAAGGPAMPASPVQAGPNGPAAETANPPARLKGLARESTVRVPAERLDRLVNLVGELVMNQSRLARAASQSGAPELANPVQELERLVAELRDDVLGIRMLPIGTLFGRFRRLVHDLSLELGKEVDLITEGAETELDKSILDQLGEPLVHCLRNCLDHGIEPSAERTARGKPARGTVRLSAVHTGSDVVISIQDDGHGIDKAAVRAKAIEKQLIAPDASLSDREAINLILLPGFSTAQEVTSVSGRGVGMDAVKRQIDALRGTLSLTSEHGKGTRVSITLPLTLAIIEGLLIQIGDDQFIVPMAAVAENVELTSAERARKNGRNVIAVRGKLVPYIDVRGAFRVGGEAPAIEKVVIVKHEDDRVGLVVDRVLGTHQTVIQSLGKFFRNITVVSGATVMGDGRVALIMDIAAVVRFAESQTKAGSASTWAGAELKVAC